MYTYGEARELQSVFASCAGTFVATHTHRVDPAEAAKYAPLPIGSSLPSAARYLRAGIFFQIPATMSGAVVKIGNFFFAPVPKAQAQS
jgi:hypothetical protein